MSTAVLARVEALALEFAGPSVAVSADEQSSGWSCTVWGAKGETLLCVRGEKTRTAALLMMRNKLRSVLESRRGDDP